MKIAILGAGNMGTAIAHALAGHGRRVMLWDHFPEVIEDVRRHRQNRRFLPGVALHPSIEATPNASECVAHAALTVVSVPSAFVVSTLRPIVPFLTADAILLNLAKGFAPRAREPLPFLLARLSQRPCAHLAGPAIANEFARGKPAPVVVAADNEAIAKRVANCLRGAFLAETTIDLAGAALSGVLKNVYAILLGAVNLLSGGSRNLEAAALCASAREMAIIARANGGMDSTVYGLAGLGDLAATGFSPDSHNRRFGQMLAAGKTARELQEEAGWLPEGARAAAAVCGLAKASGTRAPLGGLVRRWLHGPAPSLDQFSRALHAASEILG